MTFCKICWASTPIEPFAICETCRLVSTQENALLKEMKFKRGESVSTGESLPNLKWKAL